jgi:hypothetical protein
MGERVVSLRYFDFHETTRCEPTIIAGISKITKHLENWGCWHHDESSTISVSIGDVLAFLKEGLTIT